MKCLWARVRGRPRKRKKKKKMNTMTLHWEMCAFFHCLRNSMIHNCKMHLCTWFGAFFSLRMLCAIYGNYYRIFSLNDNIDIAPCIRILFQPRFKLVCSKLNLAFSVNNIAVTNCSREIKKKMAIMKTQYSLEILFQNYFRR